MDLKITIKPAKPIRHPKIARDFYDSAAFYSFRQKHYYVIIVFHFTVMRFHSRNRGYYMAARGYECYARYL